MKNSIVTIVLVVLAGAGGYLAGSRGSSGNTSGADAKNLQDSMTMMKEQSAVIKKMGEMMIESGVMMQKTKEEHNDEAIIMKGKDLEAVGAKYIKDDESQTTKDAPMKQMMGN